MAFGAFRMMMGAAGVVVGPPPGNTNTLTPHVASHILNTSAAIVDTTSITNNIILAGDANYVLATTSDPASTNTLYASLMLNGTSFDTVPATTASLRLSNSYSGNPLPQVSGDIVSSTGWIIGYIDNSEDVFARYLTRSSNTLTSTVGQTTIYSGGDATTCKTCVLDSSNAIIMANNGTTTAAGTNTYTLVNPTTLSITSSVGDAHGGVSVQSWQSLIGLSSTLSVFISVTNGFGIRVQGIDRSGSTLTINSPTTLPPTLPSSNQYSIGLIGACKVTSSTVLVVYYKSFSGSTATIGARILTIASGGSVTVGTEQTYSFAAGSGSTLNAQSIAINTPAILSSTAAVISFGVASNIAPASGYCLYGLPLAISGTSITLSSNIYPLTSFNMMYEGRDGNLCSVDSTHFAVQWLESPHAFNSAFTTIADNQNRAVFVDVNNQTPTWSSIGSLKNFASLASLTTSSASTSATYACPLQFYVVDNAANLVAYTLSNEAAYGVGTVYNGSGANGHLPKTCNLSFFDGTSGAGPTVRTLQISRNAAGSMLAYIADANDSTSSGTFSVSGTISTSRNTYQLLNYGATDQSFFIYSNGTTSYNGGIVDTSAGVGSISYSDNTFISSSTLGTGFTAPSLSVISSTAVIMAYVDGNNIKAVIFTISGGSVTTGTPVTIFSGTGTPTLTAGIAVLGATNGVITYSDTGTSTVLYSNGITWSGSTITVGTQSTVLTSQTFIIDGYNIASKSVKVSPTQAIYTYWDSGAIATRALLLTYNNINSITAGTPLSINTNISATFTDLSIGLMATESGNAIVAVQNYENIGTYQTDAQYLYRG